VTFAELQTRVLEDAFPDGPPENLTGFLGRCVSSALVEIQRDIPCFQYGHVDVTCATELPWHAGAVVVTPPKGRIMRVFTVEPDEDPNWASPVILRPVTLGYLRRWKARFLADWAWSADLVAPASGNSYGLGFDKVTATSDAATGRALTGVYAFDKHLNQLWVAPWLQSTESLVIEWVGIKRDWSDADEVPEDEDFIRLVRLWVELEFGRKYAASDLAIRENAYREARADMMATCSHERQIHAEPTTPEEQRAAYWAAYVPETVADATSDSTVVCFVGETFENATDVAAEIPTDANVVLLGSSKGAGGDADTDMAPYEDFAADGRLKAVLGAVDLDDGDLAPDVRAFARNPGNGRYYSVTYGPVTVFVANSGLNSDEDEVEPDGNYDGSVQSSTLRSEIVRNTSPWKILCVHHPLFTSSSTSYPGVADIRWINKLPVHAVVTAGARVYERLTVAGRTNIAVGTGGAELHEFRDNPYPGSETRVASFGYLKLTADCDSATLDFIDLDGTVQDTLELSGDPYVTPVTVNMDPVITTQPEGASVVIGLPYEVSVVASGTNPLSYQWQLDGEDIVDANDDTYAIDAVAATHRYRCLVTNSVGGVLSVPATVTAVSGSVTVVDNLTTFHAGTYAGSAAIALGQDGNGAAAFFVAGGTGADDGVNVIRDSANNPFTRWQFV
jgi:hypothetical protein